MLKTLLLAAIPLLALPTVGASRARGQSLASLGPLPKRGAVSTQPAPTWEWGMVTGNGRMGALMFGDPENETVTANHCRLFLPLGSREVVPNLGPDLPEIRRLIREKGYDAGWQLMYDKAKAQGYPGLQWTDPYHLGFQLKIATAPNPNTPAPPSPSPNRFTQYARTEDFQTGEITTRWVDDMGLWQRRLFVSRPDNVIALLLKGPGPGTVSCVLTMPAITHPLINSEQVTTSDWMTCHNVYVCGKGGYDSAVRVVVQGGKAQSDGSAIHVTDADEVLLLARIEPFATVTPGSAARLKTALSQLPADYERLFAPHANAHGALFNRVSLDVGGGSDRALTTDALLDTAKQIKQIPPALLEKVYDASRYVFLCSAGDRPPNLQGIWNGDWNGAWSSDYTTDTNLELAITSACSANMTEGLQGYFHLVEESLPDWRTNAHHLYGCRGVLAPPRQSNNGLLLHWDRSFPGQFWTCGAGWMAHDFYDYYLYTGDRKFLAAQVVPLLKQIALFYQDFLFVDETGHYRFSPSYSAENGVADNSTQDIAVAREVLTNLIQARDVLDTERESIPRWQAMLAKMPPYLISADGALKEWAIPEKGDNYNHRHYSHLYPIWGSHEFSPETTPELWQAAKVALAKRLEHSGETASHGRMHAGLTAVALGEGDIAYSVLERMVLEDKFYSSLVTSHDADPHIFNVDANGAMPEIINEMLVSSWQDTLDLLPALPAALPRGTVSGLLARGRLKINQLRWDKPAGRLTLDLTSGVAQTLTLRLPQAAAIMSLKVLMGTAPVQASPRGANCREIMLPKSQRVLLEVTW